MEFVPAIFQAGKSIYDGMVKSSELKADAQVADQNARTTRLQANAREDLIRQQSRQKLGEQRAAAVQSGFDPNTGSLLDLQADSAGALELDALTTRYEGTLQALSFSTQADNMRRRAKAATRSGYLNAAGELLGGARQQYGGSAIDLRGYNGTNDRSIFSAGSDTDWHRRYGRSGD
jgi:hypothetical protein